jgi:hypothetical protein
MQQRINGKREKGLGLNKKLLAHLWFFMASSLASHTSTAVTRMSKYNEHRTDEQGTLNNEVYGQ